MALRVMSDGDVHDLASDLAALKAELARLRNEPTFFSSFASHWERVKKFLLGERYVKNEHHKRSQGYDEWHCKSLGPDPCKACKEMACPF